MADEKRFDTPSTGVTPSAVTVQHNNGQSKRSWLDATYRGYESYKSEWQYVDDHYTGKILDPLRITEYLIRRAAAESWGAYNERKKIAAYTPLLSTVIDSLVGMLFAVESEAVRVFQPEDDTGVGLGQPEDRGTVANRLWYNVDGEGTNYRPHWQKVATELAKYTELYLVVDGARRAADGTTAPRIRIVPPMNVTNRLFSSDGALKQVLIVHDKDLRESLMDTDGRDSVKHYTLYRWDGWTTYIKDKDGDAQQVDEGKYTYYETTERNRLTLPVVRVRLPMSRNVSYMAARLVNRIFNLESEQQLATRVGNIARFVLVSTPEMFEKHIQHIKGGAGVLQHTFDQPERHYFVDPPIGPATLSNEIINRETEAFFRTTFMQFGDASRQVTATQIRQESRSGVEAFLTVLSDALDEAESQCLWRIEQTEFPNRFEAWDKAAVRRSKEFEPIDTAAQIEGLAALAFPGKAVPWDVEALVQAAQRIGEYYGVETNDDEVAVIIQTMLQQQAQDQAALRVFE